MKFYWKMVIGCAAVMLIAGYMIHTMSWGLSAMSGTLLAGYLGVKIAPRVPALREGRLWKVVAFLVVAGILQGASFYWRLPLAWGLGLFGSLLLPLAGLAFDSKWDDECRAEMLRGLRG